nr:hypothetical protein [Trichocoleus sp. FACHB-46]
MTLIEAGWSQEDMAKNYSSIQPETIAAVFQWYEEQQNLKAVLDALREVH